ncbi:MAG: outer membrane biosynthesis protein TonB [Desulforhopalus sp.]|jgi:outer membrane biosynthesis protein TonB
MATPITAVSGIGAQTAEILVGNGFESAEVLAAAQEEDLLKISGFGPSKAKKFIAAAQELVRSGASEDVQVSAGSNDVEVKVEAVVEQQKTTTDKPSGPKVCTQKLSKKKKKKKDKAGKVKKKKPSRKKSK